MRTSYYNLGAWLLIFAVVAALSWPTQLLSEKISLSSNQIDSIQEYDGVIKLVCLAERAQLGRLRGRVLAPGSKVKLLNVPKKLKALKRKREKILRECANSISLCRKKARKLRRKGKFIKESREHCREFSSKLNEQENSSSSSSSSSSTASTRSSSSVANSSSSSSFSSSPSSSSSSSSESSSDFSSSSSIVPEDFFFEDFVDMSGVESIDSVAWDGITKIYPTHDYASHPVALPETVLQLNFDDPADVNRDYSLHQISTTCTACPSSEPNGRIGSAALFDGTQGLVTGVEHDRYRFDDTDFTWSVWFKTTASGNRNLLGTYCGYGHLQSHLRLSNGVLQLFVNPAAGDGVTLESAGPALNDGQWHHVAAIREHSSGQLRVFVDGVENNSTPGTSSGGPITCGRFAVGTHSISGTGSGGFEGLIDGASFYSRALSVAEIERQYLGIRTGGTVESITYSFEDPIYWVGATLDSDREDLIKLEVSLDGETWCQLNRDLQDPTCPYPSQNLKYRVNFEDLAHLDSVTFGYSQALQCVDYDLDGYGIPDSDTSACQGSGFDCDDGDIEIFPNNGDPFCNCDFEDGAVPGTEICGDGFDNDCDGAADEDDNECYTDGTIYYVSNTTGSDSNSGLAPKDAWKSVALAQSALELLVQAGDKVLFRRDDIWTEASLTVPRKSGTAAQPILLSSYGAGARPRFHVASPGMMIRTDQSDYVIIEDFHLTRQSKYINAQGISVKGDYNTIRNVHIQGTGYGLSIGGSYVLIEESVIEDNDNELSGGGHSQGLWVFSGSDYGVVRNNEWHRNGKRTIFDHNIYLGGGNYWIFEGNLSTGSGGTSFVFHGIQDGHIIRDNVFHDNDTFALDISEYEHDGDYDMHLTNFLVENNLIYQNRGGFWMRGAENLTIQNNIFLDNTGSIMAGGDGPDHQMNNVVFQNNTFLNGGEGIFNLSSAGELTFRNNIVYHDGSERFCRLIEIPEGAGPRILNNNLYNFPNIPNADCFRVNGVYLDLAGFQQLGYDTNSIYSDPGFVDLAGRDVRLTAVSPAVDNGEALPEVSRDFAGTLRPRGAGWDIGAYER